MNRTAVPFRRSQSIEAIVGFPYGVTVFSQKRSHQLSDGLFILYQQQGLSSADGNDLFLVRHRRFEGLVHTRQIDLERSPLPGFAINPNEPAALLDDAVHGRQSEPCPLSLAFGREEWFEDVTLRLSIHAMAGVANGKQHILAALRWLVSAGRI